jgi:hypothetical protein
MPGGGRATGEIEDARCVCWSERRELVEIGGGGRERRQGKKREAADGLRRRTLTPRRHGPARDS